MSCDSSKCDLKRSYGLPSDEQEETTPEDRQLEPEIAKLYTNETREYAQAFMYCIAGPDGKKLQRMMSEGLVDGNTEAKQP